MMVIVFWGLYWVPPFWETTISQKQGPPSCEQEHKVEQDGVQGN